MDKLFRIKLLQYNFELASYAIKCLVKPPLLRTVFNSVLHFKSNQVKAWLCHIICSGWNFLILKKFVCPYLLFHHCSADALQGPHLSLALFEIRFALCAIAYYIT